MTPVADHLLRLRLAQGLSQVELARRALLTPANLCAIETGRSDLTVGTLFRIARALGCEPRDLVSRPAGLRSKLGRFTRDAVARAAITGRPLTTPALQDLARGLAATNRPVLAAAGAAGARRASRRAWRRARLVWDPRLLADLDARVRKLAWSGAAMRAGHGP